MVKVSTSRNCWLFCRFLRIILVLGGVCVALPEIAHATTFTVDSTGDGADSSAGNGICDNGSGKCTLRAAIQESNAAGASNTINFNIPGDTDGACTGLNGVCTISPASALPQITRAGTTIDGTTQGGASANTASWPSALNGALKIVIDGGSAGAGVNGLNVNNVGSVVIKGLVIKNFNNTGIRITGASATNNKVQGCYIGTTADGETASAITGDGINIASSATGTIVGSDGDGANEAAERNLISAATYQVEICDGCSSTRVAGNFIGTDKDGDTDLSAAANAIGVLVYAVSTTVGTNGDGTSDSTEGNLIAGQNNGLYLHTNSNAAVAGNYIGLNAAGTGSVPNANAGVFISSTVVAARVGTNADGTSDTTERNVIANSGYGVYIAGTNVVVAGNYIGTNSAGTAALGNSGGGIGINSTGARIGTNGDGTNDSVEGNLISGNGRGIYFYDSGDTGAVIAGNTIGLNAAGTAAIQNTNQGIYVQSGSNRIGTNGDGTSDAAEQNVISGNATDGIWMSGSFSGNTIAGNYIGTGANGTTDMGNGQHGIYIAGGANTNTIGGDIADEANIIAYNGNAANEYGIYIAGAGSDGNDILRNSIFSNQNEGIKLNGDGSNNDQAAPNITGQSLIGGNLTLSGTSTASATIQVFEADDATSREGKTYIGQTTANGAGSWSFVLNSPYNEGGRVIVATATDATNGTSQFSSSYTVVSNAPVASAQTVTPNEDTNVTITLGLTDADGDPLTTTIVTLPASGTLYQTADGTTLGAAITSAGTTVTDSNRRTIYVPAANANGNGVGNFTFRGNDGLNNSNTATVTVNITAVNDAPVATAQTVSVNEDASRAIILAGTDVEGDSLMIAVVSNPAHGSLSGYTSGTGTLTVTYTPTANYNGADSFTFRAYDGSVYGSPATVTLNIANVNDAPTAGAVSATVNQPTVTVTFSAADIDNNPLRYAIVSNPSHGSLSGLNAVAGTVTYTPTSGYRGTDTFTYKANDGTADSNTAVVTLTVELGSTNNAPTVFAGSDLVAVEGSPVTLIGNATDEDGDSLTYQWTQGAGISVSLANTDRSWISFTAPAPDGTGDLEFVLTVSDGTDTATDSVRVRVSRRNFTMDSAVKLTGRVVAASEGMAITSEEGVRYDGHEATAVDLGNGSVLYSTDSTPVEVATLGDKVVVGDSAHNDNAGVVVMVDTASMSRGAEIDLNDRDFADTAGVIASYGDQKGDLFGYVIRTADIDGDGSREILSLAPGTSNGMLYVLSGDDLEVRNLILGSEAEGLKSSLIFTTDLNGEGSEDMLIGLPSSAIADLTSADGALLASVTPTATVLGGILGGDDLPTVIDLTEVDADFVVTASADVSGADGGDLDGSGSEDIVMSASGALHLEVIFGNAGVGGDETSLSAGNQLTTDDTSLGAPNSMGVDDVTGDGFADIVLGFSTADGGNGKILVVPGRGNWDADAYDLDNAITVNGADGDGIGEWLILEDYDGDGVVDIYTNEGSDGSYLITLGKLIDEASGGGSGDEADSGGSGLGPGGFSGCSLDKEGVSADVTWLILFAVPLVGFLLCFRLRHCEGLKLDCHPERSEGSPKCTWGILRPADGGTQNDTVLLLLFLILSLSHCGGSSSGSGTPTDEGGSGGSAPAEEKTYITLTGRITSPTVSTSVSALEDQIPPSPPFVKGGRGGILSKGGEGGILSKESFVTDRSSAGVRCRFYNLNGDSLGAVTTNESGDFVTTVGLSATEDDPTARIVVSCENGIQNYAETDLTGGDTDVDLDIADMSSTLATVSLIDDFEEWGENYSTEVSGRDMGCLFALNRAVWDEAVGTGEGLSDDNAVLKEVVEGFLAVGGEPESAGYDDWPSLLHDVINGEAEGGPWETLVDTASAVGIDAGEYAGRYSEATEAFQAVAGTVSEQIDALYEEAGTTGDTTTSDVCGDIKDGDIDPTAFVAPILSADNVGEVATVYDNPDGMLLHLNLLKECKEGGTCREMINKPSAFLGFMAGFSGDYSNVFTGATPNTDTVAGMFRVAENCTGVSAGNIKACGRGMHVTVFEGEGWTPFKGGDGLFDPDQFVTWGGYWTNEAPDPGGSEENFINAFNDIRDGICGDLSALPATPQPHLQHVGANIVANPTITNSSDWELSGSQIYDGTVSRTAGSGSIKFPNSFDSEVTQLAYLKKIDITAGKTYVFSAYMRSSVWPPGLILMRPAFYNASDQLTINSPASRWGVTTANQWQEITAYFATRPTEVKVELKFTRKTGPRNDGDIWIDDVTIREMDERVRFDEPPAAKDAFTGTQTKVDALGNVEIFRNGTWEPFFPLCIYGDGARPNFNLYSEQGFNCNARMNDTASIQRSKDAVSAFNPDGMLVTFDTTFWTLGNSSLAELSDKLDAIRNAGLDDRVLMYYWDNEFYTSADTDAGWARALAATNIVKEKDLDAYGRRRRPIYALQGDYGAARMYHNDNIRMTDVIGTYVSVSVTVSRSEVGPFDILDNIEDQANPMVFTQMNLLAVPNQFRPLLYWSIARGAKGMGFWRDFNPATSGGDSNYQAYGSIEQQAWWSDFPNLRREIDQLLPLIRRPHWTSWKAVSSNSSVKLGTRDYNDEGYIIAANMSATASTATIMLFYLYPPVAVRNFFTGAVAASLADAQFTVTLPAYGTAVYRLEKTPGLCD